MPAWWFAVISVITSIISIVSMVMQKAQPIDTKSLLGAIVGLLTSILIFFAAETIKKAAGK